MSRPDRHQLPVYGDVMKAEYQEIRDSYQRADRLCQEGRMSKQIRHEMNRMIDEVVAWQNRWVEHSERVKFWSNKFAYYLFFPKLYNESEELITKLLTNETDPDNFDEFFYKTRCQRIVADCAQLRYKEYLEGRYLENDTELESFLRLWSEDDANAQDALWLIKIRTTEKLTGHFEPGLAFNSIFFCFLFVKTH